MKFNLVYSLGVILSAVVLSTAPVQAQVEFTNGDGNDLYLDTLNWSSFALPATSNGQDAQIDDGAAVNYVAGPDLVISNGGELEITSGSFTETVGPAYVQLGEQGSGSSTGGGTILVDGGTYNQGTDSAGPFNITGTNNLFKITAGAANFNASFALNVGLTYTQTGGIVTTGGEFDFNYLNSGTISGGTLNTTLITGQNKSTTTASFNVSGGKINLSNATGIYAPGPTQYLNFTLGSTGDVSFNGGDSLGTVEGFITSGGIEYNNTVDSSAFTLDGLGALSSDFLITGVTDPVTSSQTDYQVTLNPVLLAAVPEPSTYLMMGLGLLVLIGYRKRFSVLG